jgi:hypothetical protein
LGRKKAFTYSRLISTIVEESKGTSAKAGGKLMPKRSGVNYFRSKPKITLSGTGSLGEHRPVILVAEDDH